MRRLGIEPMTARSEILTSLCHRDTHEIYFDDLTAITYMVYMCVYVLADCSQGGACVSE